MNQKLNFENTLGATTIGYKCKECQNIIQISTLEHYTKTVINTLNACVAACICK